MKTTHSPELIKKYNVPAPRYTSYPTVPYWENNLSISAWKDCLKHSFDDSKAISIYVHLPFCESLCTYCACNTRITKRHSVEEPYLKAVLKEWQMYLDILGDRPIIKEIHLGGGTPTFFSPENLGTLVSGLLAGGQIGATPEFAFEGHPANTTAEHLQTLYALGFTRVSFGIQDFDEKIMDVINRYQSFEQVAYVTNEARRVGYTSINYDLVFGLPFQTLETITDTISQVLTLRPERIAFYSYAHVPWVKPGQRKFSEVDLPSDGEKRALYEAGRKLFESAGYVEVGMDHFALPNDELCLAQDNGTLHRNFMGYTTSTAKTIIALGVSAISDAWYGFAQNEKVVEAYQKTIEEGFLAVERGHVLSDEDLILRQHILNLMCRFETSWDDPKVDIEALRLGVAALDEMEKDGLVIRSATKLEVTPAGRAFVRNVCMALDARLRAKKPDSRIFSAAV